MLCKNSFYQLCCYVGTKSLFSQGKQIFALTQFVCYISLFGKFVKVKGNST